MNEGQYRGYDRGYESRGRAGYGQRRDDRGGPGGGGYGEQQRRGTPLSELDPAMTEVSRKVIGCAIEVHMALGPGYEEDVYTTALKGELDAAGVSYKERHDLPISYKGRVVGRTTADLFVDNRFIVEIMARTGEIGGAERTALRGQLRAADVELGLIINFGERRLKDGLVRVLNPNKLNAMKGEAGEEGDEGGMEEGEE